MEWSKASVFCKTAVQARRIALQMIQTTIVCAPDRLRDPLRQMNRMQLIRTLAAWRPDLTAYLEVEEAYRISLKSLARRYLELHDEIADLDDMIEAIVKDLAPELLEQTAIGLNSAAQLLLTAGDNPERLRSEASFAALCGVSPVPASSGKTVRHRLNRGGDRAANSGGHIIKAPRHRSRSVPRDCYPSPKYACRSCEGRDCTSSGPGASDRRRHADRSNRGACDRQQICRPSCVLSPNMERRYVTAREMRVGPSGSAIRSRSQTTTSCCL